MFKKKMVLILMIILLLAGLLDLKSMKDCSFSCCRSPCNRSWFTFFSGCFSSG
ncbi:hypothetical protein LLY41_01375 [Cytobacillus firmus]|uniref:hypothetical protein n=1 Tax=Cytobacillus firmus TaxID=1399 RepID=UPI0021882403|nr:hypothetical protein [Cytobacillus firmus]URM33170.1 hypothetical protein LLY41_01375 [Cytobacillus firmus]